MAPLRSALRIDGLEVRFPGLEAPALAVPHFILAAGARLGLTGPSGSGKTTFINMITGLERARAGRILWGEADIAGLSEGRRDRWRGANIGLVMQDFHLFDGLSARENVLLPLRLSHLALPAGAKDEADRLLARVGVARRDQRVETLSRGQKQRVAVARALIAHPGIIVADEPTASLDQEAGDSVGRLLVELASEAGATLIVASHDPRLLARMDRQVRLEAGRLIEVEG